ncbi:SO2930 family diheme c-type cytochrome [Emticicia fluvialis]|uniref:SO2930 family diheme c-type cytochrome n=1 Tax=Emticicia fluvialis TaxID=2974474 RepID=UPI0021653846|nr:SO2930 family diheme c-type cytochrome [Emticicia fluvialis]
MHKIVFLLLALGIFAFTSLKQETATKEVKASMPREKLSDYHFFEGNMAAQKPVAGVVPYSLNTPLFSDYAEKLRFVKLPEGAKVPYNATEVLDFPVGSTLIKTFYYPNDFRNIDKGRRIMETRLLIHEPDGWKALAYVWNDEQTEAYLEVAGDTKEVSYIDLNGKKKKHEYSVPNLNQCKGCHNRNEVMSPIGPSARQLNGSYKAWGTKEETENQLIAWQKTGVLQHLPALELVPKAPVWNKPETGTLDERARIWLDINCAHCHRLGGPAQTSGLNLSIHETDQLAYGIMKTPVAAGRGSGNRKFDIVPGKPEESILLYRIESTDPGEMMPEVGRKTNHKEGIELIKEWIKQMKKS